MEAKSHWYFRVIFAIFAGKKPFGLNLPDAKSAVGG
jgi:hypothetical protein